MRPIDIGKPIRTITIEPAQEPVPQRERTSPARDPIPQRAPRRTPEKAPGKPRRAPKKVPA